MRLLRPVDVRAQRLPERLLLLPLTPLLPMIITIGVLRAFSRFVELLVPSFRLPFSEPNFSRPSRPRAIDAIRSS
jgi:hypothetical protein